MQPYRVGYKNDYLGQPQLFRNLRQTLAYILGNGT
mgnify:CR=1 FL=1